MTHAVCTFNHYHHHHRGADQRLLSTLPDEKDLKVLAKGLEVMACAKTDGWFTPSELLSLSVQGVLVRVFFPN